MSRLVGGGVGSIQIAEEALHCVDLNFNLSAAGKDQIDTALFGVIDGQKVHKSIGMGFIEAFLFDRFDVINVKARMDTLVGMIIIVVRVVVMITLPTEPVGDQVELAVGFVIVKACNGDESILETGRKNVQIFLIDGRQFEGVIGVIHDTTFLRVIIIGPSLSHLKGESSLSRERRGLSVFSASNLRLEVQERGALQVQAPNSPQ